VGPAAAPCRAPQPSVDGVRGGLRRHRQAALGEEGDRSIAGQAELANRGNDLEVGCQHPERNVEAHLIIARPGRPVRDGAGADAAGGLDHGECLLGPLRRDAERIHLAPEDVGLNQVADEAIVDRAAGVDLMVLDRPDRARLRADGGTVGGGGPAGVDVDGVHRPPVAGEAGDAEAGVEPAGEGEGERAARLHSA
jgi:hypothetical protein